MSGSNKPPGIVMFLVIYHRHWFYNANVKQVVAKCFKHVQVSILLIVIVIL